MALSDAYVLPTNRIADVFAKIRDGQAPDQLTVQLLKDWDFRSSNDRAFIPLLKALGFLTADGRPTKRYHDYRDHSQSKAVMGQALKEAYGDIFLIKAKPTTADKTAIAGKFKSFHNQSDNVAEIMTRTFFALLALADLDSTQHAESEVTTPHVPPSAPSMPDRLIEHPVEHRTARHVSGLHYNIQIHLPSTKDVEVYNAIFKSLREHLIEE